MPDMGLKFNKQTGDRVDALIEVLDRIATAMEVRNEMAADEAARAEGFTLPCLGEVGGER